MPSIAKIYKAHGLRGELQLRYINQDGLRLSAGDAVKLTRPDGQVGDFVVAKLRETTRGVLLSFKELSDRTAVEPWQGSTLAVSEAALPEPEPGRFYRFQLIDCQVCDAAGQVLGRVSEVSENGAHDLLHVQSARGEWLLPMVEAFVVEVDPKTRQIKVGEVQGLIDLIEED